MKTKIFVFLVIFSLTGATGLCDLRGQASGKNQTTSPSDEVKKIKVEASEVITEYNRTAENVKYNAIKNKKNLPAEVKKTIIEMEEKVSDLEDKIENIGYQNNENWSKLREEIKSDITSIRKGIKDLSGQLS